MAHPPVIPPPRQQLQDLRPAFLAQLELERSKATKMICDGCNQPCEDSKGYACQGCVIRGGLPVYYCNPVCQRLGWQAQHRDVCVRSTIPRVQALTEYETSRKAREGERRAMILHNVLSWASHMFLLGRGYDLDDAQRARSAMRFHFHSTGSSKDPWVLLEVEYVPNRNTLQEIRYFPGGRPPPMLQGAYVGVFDDELETTLFAPVELGFPFHFNDYSYVPQWPQLLRQLCTFEWDTTTDWIINHRMRKLLSVITEADRQSELGAWLTGFALAPSPSRTRVAIDPNVQEEWMEVMGDILCF